MFELWCEAGFEPDPFWRQTPRSFHHALAGVRRRLRAEAGEDPEPPQIQRQSPEAMLAIVRQIKERKR